MTELKTLKDLQKEYEWKYDTYKALKAEAVKWVKDLERNMLEKGRFDIIDWIKIFFNLTEEDLK